MEISDSSSELKNFRVVNAFIKRSDGKLWIPRRVSSKKIFPNALDMSVAGHVEYGESYEESFAREAMEEANIDVTKVPVKYLGKLSPYEVQELSAFQMVWEIQLNDEPDYNRNDFSEAYWLTPQELWNWIASGEPSKTDLPHLVKAFYPIE
jgi:NADH pyrophosphatase NudC (nudix superfamily)